MRSPRRIAVLQDSPDFGGHERAFLTWLPALLAAPDIESLHLRVPEANVAFLAALAAASHPKLHVTTSPYVKQRGEPYRAPIRFRYGLSSAAFVKKVGADLVLLLQGRIENLATPALWLPRTQEIVSYLPMAHSGVEMGRSRGLSAASDAIKRFYYARPQRTIVPSHAVADQARRAGAQGPVHVVENVPPPGGAGPWDTAQARSTLGIALGERVALFMGRFDSHQKGLDRLLREMRAAGQGLAGWRFIFVGQGPAESDIRAALQSRDLCGDVVAWTADPDRYLAAADVLVAPSRFEGVPLIMLEALKRGLPILASDIDVYREYLPGISLFDFSRPVGLATALKTVTSAGHVTAYQLHAGRICKRLDLATSQRKFLQALLGDPSVVQGAALSSSDKPALEVAAT